MTISLTVQERRLSDDSPVFDVIISNDERRGTIVLPAITKHHADRLTQALVSAISFNTIEVLNPIRWERAE